MVFWPARPHETVIELPHYGAAKESDGEYWDTLMTECLRLPREVRI